MSKIILIQSTKDALAAARRAQEKRTHLWADIRRVFGIPKSIKLAVTVNRELYVKGTDPKQFLLLGSDGRYSHAAADPVVAPVAPVADVAVAETAAVTQAPARFVVAAQVAVAVADTGWSRAKATDVALLLRGNDTSDDIEDNVALPDGFPTLADDFTGVVFDADTGYVYFRT